MKQSPLPGGPNLQLLGCPRKLGSMVSKWVISYNLLINGVFLGVKKPTDPITIDLITSVPGHPSNLGVLGIIE